MPIQVDHEARRQQVADALLQVTARHGLEAASIAKIAEEIGATTGLVQRYFRTKDELLLFAFDRLTERALARLAQAEQTGSIRLRLHRAIMTFLPLDEERMIDCKVTLAFNNHSLTSPQLHRVLTAANDVIYKQCAASIAWAQKLGEAPAKLNPEHEAKMLTAFADGLTLHMIIAPEEVSPLQAEQLLLSYLNRVFEVP